MRIVAALIGVAVAAGAVWLVSRRADDTAQSGGVATWGDALAGVADDWSAIVDGWIGDVGMVRVSSMKGVDRRLLNNPNVIAAMAMIRQCEVGTTGPAGYRMKFGDTPSSPSIADLSDHPRIIVRRSGYASSAAGAYQATIATWDETAAAMGLPDFSPASQDLFCLGRLAARGALPDLVAGRLDAALRRMSYEWASLPPSRYGQTKLTAADVRAIYLAQGGQETSGGVYA